MSQSPVAFVEHRFFCNILRYSTSIIQSTRFWQLNGIAPYLHPPQNRSRPNSFWTTASITFSTFVSSSFFSSGVSSFAGDPAASALSFFSSSTFSITSFSTLPVFSARSFFASSTFFCNSTISSLLRISSLPVFSRWHCVPCPSHRLRQGRWCIQMHRVRVYPWVGLGWSMQWGWSSLREIGLWKDPCVVCRCLLRPWSNLVGVCFNWDEM